MMRRFLLTAILLPALMPAFRAFAQDEQPAVQRPSIGVRVYALPFRMFDVGSATASTTAPVADYNYSSTTKRNLLSVGPTLEYRIKGRFSIGLEFRIHEAQYVQTTQVRTGKKDPNSSTDDRKVTTITQTTRASYWELPLLLRYDGLLHGWLGRKTYALGGVQYRRVRNIRTGNEYAFADGTTDYNEIAAVPSRKNQIGGVVGIGLRFRDDYNIKIAPEVRYVLWQGKTFQGPGFASRWNQLEGGVGISF